MRKGIARALRVGLVVMLGTGLGLGTVGLARALTVDPNAPIDLPPNGLKVSPALVAGAGSADSVPKTEVGTISGSGTTLGNLVSASALDAVLAKFSTVYAPLPPNALQMNTGSVGSNEDAFRVAVTRYEQAVMASAGDGQDPTLVPTTDASYVKAGFAQVALDELLLQQGVADGLTPDATDLNKAADLQVEYYNADPNLAQEPPLPGGVTPEVFYHSPQVLAAMSRGLTRNAERVKIISQGPDALATWAASQFEARNVHVNGLDLQGAALAAFLPAATH